MMRKKKMEKNRELLKALHSFNVDSQYIFQSSLMLYSNSQSMDEEQKKTKEEEIKKVVMEATRELGEISKLMSL